MKYSEKYYIVSDSITGNDTIQFIVEPKDVEATLSFYDTLKKRASRNRLLSTIHNFLIVETEDNRALRERKFDEVDNPFMNYQGKKIQSIKVKQLSVFGTVSSDSLDMDLSWYKEFGNWMHISTHESIIRKNLLFDEGEEIDPFLLADNERVLRRLPYLKEARIFVDQSKTDSQSVNVVVVTQDVWSKGFNVELNKVDAGRIEVWDNNIFGIGHRLEGDLIFDYFKPNNPGFQTNYKIENLAGSFIDARLGYLDAFYDHNYGVTFSRDFFSYKTDWVGGFEVWQTRTRRNIRKEDTVLLNTSLNYLEHDTWLGYSFSLPSDSRLFKKRNRLVLAARYDRSKFFEGPQVSERYNYQFHDHHTFLASISFSRQNFYQSSLIYGFGRTEDIPVGDLVSYSFGWEVDEFYRRFYSGISLKHGEYFNNFGYLSSSLDFGGFIYKKDFEQGVLNFRSKYISGLFQLGNLKMRQFIDINYKYGIDRFDDEWITYHPIRDIRGFNRDDLFGDKKLVLKLETVGFTNLFYYGFRVAFYGFADLGFIGPESRFIFKNTLHSGFGLGLRIRNENLVFNTFQVRIGYYPKLSNGDTFLFRMSGEKTLAPYRYSPSAPSIIEF